MVTVTVKNGKVDRAMRTLKKKLPKEGLLQELKHYGIRGIANAWFKSYLEKRKQYVNGTVNGTDSQTDDIDHEVPQGSVLGPLLFLVYISFKVSNGIVYVSFLFLK